VGHSAVLPGGVREPPPGLIRIERRLGLPVPVPWRPWVASIILSDGWGQQKIGRMRWVRTHRLPLLLATLAFDGAVLMAVALVYGTAVLGPLVGTAFCPIAFLGTRWVMEARGWPRNRPSDDQLVGLARVHSLAANGLQPDGSLDPSPDPWTTLAALPPWAIGGVSLIALALLASAGVLLIGLFIAAITRL
jgi:hypothetical protein